MACLWSHFVILFWVRPVKLFSPSHEWRADIHQQQNSTIRTTRPKPTEWLSNADVAYTECVQSQHEHMLQHSTSSHLMLSVEKYQSMSGHRGRFPCCFMTKPRGGGRGRGGPAQKRVCERESERYECLCLCSNVPFQNLPLQYSGLEHKWGLTSFTSAPTFRASLQLQSRDRATEGCCCQCQQQAHLCVEMARS